MCRRSLSAVLRGGIGLFVFLVFSLQFDDLMVSRHAERGHQQNITLAQIENNQVLFFLAPDIAPSAEAVQVRLRPPGVRGPPPQDFQRPARHATCCPRPRLGTSPAAPGRRWRRDGGPVSSGRRFSGWCGWRARSLLRPDRVATNPPEGAGRKGYAGGFNGTGRGQQKRPADRARRGDVVAPQEGLEPPTHCLEGNQSPGVGTVSNDSPTESTFAPQIVAGNSATAVVRRHNGHRKRYVRLHDNRDRAQETPEISAEFGSLCLRPDSIRARVCCRRLSRRPR